MRVRCSRSGSTEGPAAAEQNPERGQAHRAFAQRTPNSAPKQFATVCRIRRRIAIRYSCFFVCGARGGAAERRVAQNANVACRLDTRALVHEAWLKLHTTDPADFVSRRHLVQIIEMRFFSGLEVREIAELLGVSEPTIKRGTRVAKAFLSPNIT